MVWSMIVASSPSRLIYVKATGRSGQAALPIPPNELKYAGWFGPAVSFLPQRSNCPQGILGHTESSDR